MLNSFPKHRLDAGSFGTMGVGLGFAIAAALYAKENCPEKRIICVEGDSAFGFSGMEMETIVRYKIVEVYNSWTQCEWVNEVEFNIQWFAILIFS